MCSCLFYTGLFNCILSRILNAAVDRNEMCSSTVLPSRLEFDNYLFLLSRVRRRNRVCVPDFNPHILSDRVESME